MRSSNWKSSNWHGWLLFMALSAILVSGCKASSDDPVPAPTFMVQAVSGGEVSADGTWVDCHTQSDDGGTTHYDLKEIQVHSGATLTMTSYKYTSTDATCFGGETSYDSGTGTITAIGTKTSVGWTDTTTVNTTTGPAATGGGFLPAKPTFTQGTFDGTYNNAAYNGPIGGRYIDDSGTPWKMYRTNNEPVDTCSSDRTTSGEELCLMSVDVLIKQP